MVNGLVGGKAPWGTVISIPALRGVAIVCVLAISDPDSAGLPGTADHISSVAYISYRDTARLSTTINKLERHKISKMGEKETIVVIG